MEETLMQKEVLSFLPKQEQEEKLDFEKFRDKLGSWSGRFKDFIEGEEMFKIYQKIREDAKGEKIVPDSKDTFRAFSTCNILDVKVIFYLMDPYPRLYKDGRVQATGIAMDCSNTPNGRLQPSLELWYNAIEKETGRKVNKSPSLEYLHEQGVMLLNTDLTCKLNKTGSHEGLWLPFQRHLLEEILRTDHKMVYVLCGVESKKMKRYINPFSKIFEREHPAAAAHRNGEWESKGIFLTINQILKENGQEEVMWNKDDWDKYKESPF